MREIKFRVWDKEKNKTKRIGKGWYKLSGYIMQYAPYHPYSNSRGYVPEHRLLIENKLGRYLKPRIELVHHLDGNRSNNNLDNLKLSNPKDHAKGHIGSRNNNGTFACVSSEFSQKKYRLHDMDRNLTQIYTLNELISKTFRRGKFEYRGEFTGLNDKNGKEIYEGDILKEYKEVVFHDEYLGFFVKSDEWECEWNPLYDILSPEIIGNIHENPELLEETNE